MTHKDFIAALPENVLAELNRTENAAGLWHLARHVALILGLAVWIALGWPLWQFALVAQGVAICFLFTLQHECTHKTPFASPALNEWTGRIIGVLILQPFEWFRYLHLAHHRHTNIPGKDPELTAGGKPETIWQYIRHVSGLPLWVAMARITWDNARGRIQGDFTPERAKPRLMREAHAMLGLYALVVLSLLASPLLFWIWLLPVLLGQPFLRLYLLAEHGRCAFVADMFLNTLTTYTNHVVRFLAWNMPYHTEHHTLPMVPFHKLPALNAAMQGHHKVTALGYGAFNAEFLRSLAADQLPARNDGSQ